MDPASVLPDAGELRVAGLVLEPTVTVRTLEVEDGYSGLPENVAVIEFDPEASDVPSTTCVQLPSLNVQVPSVVVPALKVTVPVATGGVVSPVAPTPVTFAFNVVDSLGVMSVSVAVSAVALVNTVSQLVIRFVTFTLPIPVASSNSGVDA